MKQRDRTTINNSKWGYSILHIILISLIVSACCTQRLNMAQNDFNKFEEKYKAIQLDLSTEDSIPYQSFFQEAYTDIQLALEEKSCLAKDDLLADAYLMKSLCEFRLDRYEGAKESADDALAEYLDMENKRIPIQKEKKWLVQILPHQVEIEQLGKALEDFYSGQNKNYDQARLYHLEYIYHQGNDEKAKLEEAIEKLESLKPLVNDSKTVQIALVSSQLAGLKIWSDGIDKFWRSSSNGTIMTKEQVNDQVETEENNHLLPRKEVLLEELEGLLSTEQAAKWVPWWETRI